MINQEQDQDQEQDNTYQIYDSDENGAAVSEDEAERIAQLVENLQIENDAMKDRLMRAMADMENLRRRTQKEVADAKSYAMASFARDMLAVGDNLRRAIDAVPEGSDDPALTSLVEGVGITERELLSAFEKHGIEQIDPLGARFDPNLHQAMFEIPNEEVPTGTILEVVAAGYVIGERVLRPAMVGVTKGGPKAPKTSSVKSDDEVLAPLATGGIGDAFMQLEQPEEALDYYVKAANMRSNSFTTPKFLLKAAITALELGNAEDALEYLNKLENEYPESPEAGEAPVFIGQAQAMN